MTSGQQIGSGEPGGDRARPVVAVSMGDPLGIGPEVIVKALADPALRRSARFMIYGVASALHEAARLSGIEPFWWQARRGSTVAATAHLHDVVLLDEEPNLSPEDARAWRALLEGAVGVARAAPSGVTETRTSEFAARPTRQGGMLSFRFVEHAVAAAQLPDDSPLRAHAIVTAPINKEAWGLAGHSKFPGHTELLAARFNARRTRMMFVAPSLKVMLVTTHIPLSAVPDALTIGRVFETIEAAHCACTRLGVAKPRIAVCGVNPHAGEAGLLGEEDGRVIFPAVQLAHDAGIDASGPWPADTVFTRAVQGKFDVVVAMYHDQGLIPVKLLAFDSAVNLTVGLPAVRTSPDHGTAYNIAWTNSANPGSTRAAIELAVALARGGGVRAEDASVNLPRSGGRVPGASPGAAT